MRLGKSPSFMHFIVWVVRRSGWLDILISCYTGDSGYPNQLCKGKSQNSPVDYFRSATRNWDLLKNQILRMIDFCPTLKIEHG